MMLQLIDVGKKGEAIGMEMEKKRKREGKDVEKFLKEGEQKYQTINIRLKRSQKTK